MFFFLCVTDNTEKYLLKYAKKILTRWPSPLCPVTFFPVLSDLLWPMMTPFVFSGGFFFLISPSLTSSSAQLWPSLLWPCRTFSCLTFFEVRKNVWEDKGREVQSVPENVGEDQSCSQEARECQRSSDRDKEDCNFNKQGRGNAVMQWGKWAWILFYVLCLTVTLRSQKPWPV